MQKIDTSDKMDMYMMKYKVFGFFQDLKDFVSYDVLKLEPPRMPEIKMNLKFKIHRDPDLIWVESVDYPNLVATGENEAELRESMFDAILTHFNVPRYRARRLPDLFSLCLEDGRVVSPPQKVPLIRASLVAA